MCECVYVAFETERRGDWGGVLQECFSDFSSCSYIKHIRSIVFHEPIFDVIFIKRLLVAKYEQEMCFQAAALRMS